MLYPPSCCSRELTSSDDAVWDGQRVAKRLVCRKRQRSEDSGTGRNPARVEAELFVVADGADLVADPGDESDFLNGICLAWTCPDVSHLNNLARL